MGYLQIVRQGDQITFEYAAPYNSSWTEPIGTVAHRIQGVGDKRSIIVSLNTNKQTLEITHDQVDSPVTADIDALYAYLQALLNNSNSSVPDHFAVTAATQSVFNTTFVLTNNYKVYKNNAPLLAGEITKTGSQQVTLTTAAVTGDIIDIYAT